MFEKEKSIDKFTIDAYLFLFGYNYFPTNATVFVYIIKLATPPITPPINNDPTLSAISEPTNKIKFLKISLTLCMSFYFIFF